MRQPIENAPPGHRRSWRRRLAELGRDYWKLGRRRQVAARATRYALVVGGILIALNHGDVLLRGALSANVAIKIALQPLVPYLVSTFSSVGAIRAARSTS